jgi:hypothetical protein
MSGPVYDCGDADCEECQKAFGPDRSTAIANYEARERYYARLEQAPEHSHTEQNLDAADIAKIDAAWERHKAAKP